MTTAYEIPLTAEPQSFVIQLGSAAYRLAVKWCMVAECWVMDISRPEDTAPLVAGIPLVTGTDLLGQYAYLGIQGELHVQSLANVDAVPSFTSLGKDGLLFFVVP